MTSLLIFILFLYCRRNSVRTIRFKQKAGIDFGVKSLFKTNMTYISRHMASLPVYLVKRLKRLQKARHRLRCVICVT